MRIARRWVVFTVLLTGILCATLLAQNPNPTPEAAPTALTTAVPTVTFTFDRPTVEPHHYTLSVESIGRAAYQSVQPETVSSGDPDIVKFTMSEATTQRIFALARQANFFQGDFNYRQHRVADTGNKTLAYAEAGRKNQTSYDWSENRAIDELTRIFTAVAATLEYGRRLQNLMQHDKLGLDTELRGMQRIAADGQLAELQTIAPLLQQIASDEGVMNVARVRARQLLERSSLPVSAQP